MKPLGPSFATRSVPFRNATKVQTDGITFKWEQVFHRTLVSFRSAVLRHCRGIRLHYIRRAHTDLIGIIPETERLRFAKLATIHQNGTYELTTPFTDAIAHAAKALEDRLAHDSRANRHPAALKTANSTPLPPRGGGEYPCSHRGMGVRPNTT